MHISIQPSSNVLGARVEGISLADSPSSQSVSEIEQALEQYGVLIFPNQIITPAQQIAFSRAFASLELTELKTARLEGFEEIFVVGNTGKGLVTFSPKDDETELEWHTDHIHRKVAARASLLYALEVPKIGGDTLFACMYHAYDQLDPDLQKQCDELTALHSAQGLELFLKRQLLDGSAGSRVGRQFDCIERPLVKQHPLTGRRALYFGNQVTIGIKGWPEDMALEFIAKLTEHACQSDFRYRHQWQDHDAVLWDNRRVLHAGTPYDVINSRRHLHRTTWRENEQDLMDLT